MTTHCSKCKAENPDTKQFCGDCGTQLTPAKETPVPTKTLEAPREELTTGSTFAGRYQIIEELGKGGMGKVYKVLDKETNEKIALKLIKPEIASDKKTVDRFRNELTTARKIVQKNVCRMYDLNKERQNYYITMEYITGQDLKGLIRQTGQLTVGKTISIAKQICEGLAEAHSLGVIHRDLKPSNIMIDQGGNAKIMDFGIARAVKGKSITGAGVMIGTPQYMSPEQVEGKEVDQRSDIYSLGIIIYEMLTDRVPFEGDTPLTVGVKQKTETPKDPKAFNERIPDALNKLIMKCLEKERESRYQGAVELKADLERLEQEFPTTDREIPKKRPLTSRELTVQLNMKKVLIPTIAIIALAAIGLLIWSPWSVKMPSSLPSDKPSLAVMYFKNNTNDENLDDWKTALPESIITDLSQSKYLKVLSANQLYSIFRDLDLLDARDYAIEDLRSVAAEGRVQYILTGSLSKAGNTYRIEYTLLDILKENALNSGRVQGEGEESVFSMVDELTIKIKQDLNLSQEQISGDFDTLIKDITTASPEAFRYYSEAQRSTFRGDYTQAVLFAERAVAIDPEFAAAYRLLASQQNNAGMRKEAIENMKKAFALSDKASDVVKYWIHADYYRFVEKDYEKSIEAYSKLFELVPDSVVGHNNISIIYRDLEEWDKALAHLKICRANNYRYIGSFQLMAWAYQAIGKYNEAEEVLREYLTNIEEDSGIYVELAFNYALQGEYNLALEETEKAIALNPNRDFPKNVTFHLKGDFGAAEAGYKKWLERDEVNRKMIGRRYLEFLYRMLGQYGKAKNEAQAGLKLAEEIGHINWKRTFYDLLAEYDLALNDLDGVLEKAEFIWDTAVKDETSAWQVNALRWKIRANLSQNNIEKALELAEEVKEILDNTPPAKDIRWYLDDLGLIEMKRKNYSKAIDLFSQVYELQGSQRAWRDPHAYILSNVASAHYLNGDLEEAKKEYEKILTLTTGRLETGDLYVKSFYMLGMINEQQGDTAKAIENYEKFLHLWKDADPGITEVDDARKRLAGLR